MNVVTEGDSITDSANAWAYPIFLGLGVAWSIEDVAISGTTTAQMLARGANVDNDFKPTFTKNVTVIDGGTNDPAVPLTPAQTWANLASWSAARHAKGFKTIVVTLMCGNSTNAPIYTQTNSLIYANWTGTFDGLADLAGNSRLAPGTCDSSLFMPDMTHPLPQTAQNIITPIIQTQILAQ